MSRLYVCRCFNFKISCEKKHVAWIHGSPAQPSDPISGDLATATAESLSNSGGNSEIEFTDVVLGLAGVKVEHNFLASCVLTDGKLHVTCVNCKTLAFWYIDNMNLQSSHTPVIYDPVLFSPLNGEISISSKLSPLDSLNDIKSNPKYSPAFRILIFPSPFSNTPSSLHLNPIFDTLQQTIKSFTDAQAVETNRIISDFTAMKLQELADCGTRAARDRETLWNTVKRNFAENITENNQKPTTLVLKDEDKEDSLSGSVGSVLSTESGLEFKARPRNKKALPGSYKELSSSLSKYIGKHMPAKQSTSVPKQTTPILRKTSEVDVTLKEKSEEAKVLGTTPSKKVKFAFDEKKKGNESEKKEKKSETDTIFNLEFNDMELEEIEDHENLSETDEEEEDEEELEEKYSNETALKNIQFETLKSNIGLLSTSLPISIPGLALAGDSSPDEDGEVFVAPHIVAARTYANETFGHLPKELLERSVEYNGQGGSLGRKLVSLA